MARFAVSVVSGNIACKRKPYRCFVEEAYKQYQTQAAFSSNLLVVWH